MFVPLISDTLARLSVYTVPSSAQSYSALLPHFLPPRTSLPHTVVLIVLDWTKPWTFVEEMQTWLSWIEDWVKSDTSREGQIVREETRERCERAIQHEMNRMLMTHESAIASTALLRADFRTYTSNVYSVEYYTITTWTRHAHT